MKRLVFAGCSFTHSGDSWAYCGRPWNNIEMHKLQEPERSKFKSQIQKDKNCYTRVEWFGPTTSYDQLENQQKKFSQKYNTSPSLLDPENFWKDSQQLPIDQYEINVFGRGSNSNTDTARAVMHFIENYEHNIDTVVFQITGFARRELYTSDPDIYGVKEGPYRYEFNVTQYDDAHFIKHWGAIDYNEVIKEDPPADYFRRTAAHFYSKIFEPEEYHIRAIESLQSLTTFCEAHNIKLGFFHGWDNYPHSEWDYDDRRRNIDERCYPSEYFKKKYDRYVKPNLLSEESIISFAELNLDKKFVYDIMDNGEHGGHPCPLAHKLYWNKVVYPFVK
jgi:hypothetical protein